MYFNSFNYWLLYNYTPYDLYFCDFLGEFVDWLVSDEDAACAAGVICLFLHYSLITVLLFFCGDGHS